MEKQLVHMTIRDENDNILHIVEFEPLTSNRKLPALIWIDFQQHIAAGHTVTFKRVKES